MVTYRKKRKASRSGARKSRKRTVRSNTAYRRNPAKKRKTAKRRIGSYSRPRIKRTSRGWQASAKDPLGLRGTRINPRRRRRKTRRNPKVNVANIQAYIKKVIPVGAGLVVGYVGMPLIYKAMGEKIPENFSKWRGLIHVGLGSLVYIFGKNQAVKTAALTIGATGVVDLLANNVPQLEALALPASLPFLEEGSESVDGYVGASYSVPVAPVSPVSQAGVGASYEAPSVYHPGLPINNGLNGDGMDLMFQ